MKKMSLFLGGLIISASAYAHTQYLYTDKLDISGMKEVKMKVLFGHPGEGNEEGAVSVGTVDGKTMPIKKFFVVHNGEMKDLTKKVKEGMITTDHNKGKTADYIFTPEDGLKGRGTWIFVSVPSAAKDEGYTFNGVQKLILTKDGAGNEWHERVAAGYPEIVPLTNPAEAWKENVFRGILIGSDNKPVANARIDIDSLEADINLKKDIYKGKVPREKSAMTIFADNNGVFSFSVPHEGIWTIRGIVSKDKEKQIVNDTSLVVEFK